jgi:membrane protease YdiL (CAAX protease family)
MTMHAPTDEVLERDAQAEAAVPATPVRSLRYSLMLLGMSVVWGVLLAQFGEGQIYWIMGPYAASMSAVLMTLRSRALLARLRPTLRNVAVGIAVGVAMTVATYPAFAAAKALFPELAQNVVQLYRQSHDESLPVALGWVVVILTAEELLWRGAWIEALTPRFGPLRAGMLSVLIYAATQLCSGSFIVCLLALCCGAVWTIQRHYTSSLISPLIAHMIWTPTVILLMPVT